ncbi:VOC family protein [Desulforhopalus singaporensis]|uniref:Methylmalonyl-CoA/ethylmalonyl-CoA epimerase n=1 Tax=Desulforhopalus singaporensis TaxID=91360 RepID=A0A1H0MFL9_9BACT|nr:VOC family protein [Desulforhopalus singaporensis]SDO79272.1 methylmalonyl-CoA/ethylmalonyl-CoA epimerase [Desulforhopalus singaporensis]
MISRIDHISIAVKDYRRGLEFFTKVFGGVPGASGTSEELGFFWQLLSTGDLSRMELLTPSGKNSFLDSFLLDKKEGAVHHITFETPDIYKMKERLDNHQIPYFGFNAENPSWKELFIHPRDSFGVLIQIAEFTPDEWLAPALTMPKGPKWAVQKKQNCSTLELRHPGGGKTELDLCRSEVEQLIDDLKKLL